MVKAFVLALVVMCAGLMLSSGARANTYSMTATLGQTACTGQFPWTYSSHDFGDFLSAFFSAANGDGCGNTYALTTSNEATCGFSGTCSGPHCNWSTFTTSCERTLGDSCPAGGTTYSATALRDYGTDPTNTNALKPACTAAGCFVIFSGESPVGRSLVNGVYHYFAKGSYEYMGSPTLCTPNTANASLPSTTSLPSNSCSGTDIATVINGVVKCVVRQTGETSASTPTEPKIGTQTTSSTLPDGSTLKVAETTYGDGSKSYKSEITPPGGTSPTSSDTKVSGSPTSYAALANPGVLSAPGGGSGSGSTTVEFPSDYSRSGEAQLAATSINDALGPKLDKITETGSDPADPLQPQASEFDQQFFSGTFNNLLGWQLPAHSSQCPTSSFSWENRTFTLDSHCQLVNNHFSVLASVMAVVWTVLALLIVLGA